MAISIHETAANSLALSDSAIGNVVRLIDVSNSLVLSESAIPNHKARAASNSLVLTDSISYLPIINEVLSQSLNLTQSVSDLGPVSGIANNILSFQQSVIVNIKEGVASNQLNLTDLVDWTGPIVIAAAAPIPPDDSIVHVIGSDLDDPVDEIDPDQLDINDLDATEEYLNSIGLRDEILRLDITYNISLTQIIVLDDYVAPTTELTASNHLFLNDLAEATEWEVLSDTIQLQHIATFDIVEPVSSLLNLTDLVDPDLVYNRSVSDTLDFNGFVTFYNKQENLCPALYLKNRSTILLTYPYVGPTTTVEVRNPQFDDTRQIEFRRINRKTRGGTLKIFRDDIWPQSERLIYSFDNLLNAKKKEILEFLEVSIGKEIGLLDFRSQQWRGIIITPTTQIGREDRPGNSLTFEFEGTIDSGGLESNIETSANIGADLKYPALQAIINTSGQLVGNMIRD
jgi:hypothetical protein